MLYIYPTELNFITIQLHVMIRLFVQAFIFFVLFSACTANRNSSATSNSTSLTGVNWSLKKIIKEQGTVSVNNPEAFIKFDATENTAIGRGGCNNFRGSFTVNGKSVTIANVLSTKMFCEQFGEQEADFFKQLERVNRYGITDAKLVLYNNDQALLEFSKR